MGVQLPLKTDKLKKDRSKRGGEHGVSCMLLGYSLEIFAVVLE